MREDIEGTRLHLSHRHGQCIRRVHQRESRVHLRIIPVTFYLSFFVGENSAAVHLAARSRHGDNDTARHYPVCHRLALHPEVLPRITVISGLHGYRFAAVHDRTSARAYDQTDIVPPCQLCPFEHFGKSRIRHDAGEFYYLIAARPASVCLLRVRMAVSHLSQHRHDVIICAVLFNGSAAVTEQDILPARSECPDHLCKILSDAALSGPDARAAFPAEILHLNISLYRPNPPSITWRILIPFPRSGTSYAAAYCFPVLLLLLSEHLGDLEDVLHVESVCESANYIENISCSDVACLCLL